MFANKPRLALATAVAALPVCSIPSLAQGVAEEEISTTMPLEEVIVTAQRRAEASIDVPITIVTLGADQLLTGNVKELSGIAKLTPGLRFDFGGGYYQPTIRGVGTPVTSAGSAGNVGIYIDGFYSPNPLSANFDLVRVENIQVLKGPQGTLFGRNTTGGAILIQTAEPSTEPAAEFKASYGRFNQTEVQGYGTYGLSDRVAIDAAAQYRSGDGWLKNISNGEKVGDYDNWYARLGLWFEVTDNVEALFRYEHRDVDDPTPLLAASYNDPELGSGAPYFALPSEVTFDRDKVATGSHPSDQEIFKSETDVFQLTIRADFGFADFTSYSQYRDEYVDSNIDLDYSGTEYIQFGLPTDNETWSQEFLLSSKPDTRLQWTAGLFYFENTDTFENYIDYAPSLGIQSREDGSQFGSSATVKSYAAFLDATYEVTSKLFLTLGVRYADDKVDDVYSQCAFGCPKVSPTPEQEDKVDGDEVTPRVVIRYRPTDQSSIYASYTQGYKAAIYDLGAGVPIPVEPEEINAYEIGYKYGGSRVSFDVSGFFYDYENLQVSVYESGTATIINAATSEIYGLDTQVRFSVTDNFQVNAGANWTHARYEEFINAPVYERCDPVGSCGFGGGETFANNSQTLKNVDMQRAPEYSGNLGASYRRQLAGGELELSGNLFYTSHFYFGPSGIQFKQKAYETLSLRAQWTDPTDTYTLAVWGENVTDSRYKTQVQYGLIGLGANWSQPVTYGVEVGARF